MSETPLLTEPVVGWRLWHVTRRNGEPHLASWSRSALWPAAEKMEARCWLNLGGGFLDPEHDAPRLDHSCGLYALRTRRLAEALLQEVGRVGLGSGRRPLAFGRVSLWGRVIENVDGFRAQYAYPYDLELVGGDEHLAAALRSRYTVDVTSAAES